MVVIVLRKGIDDMVQILAKLLAFHLALLANVWNHLFYFQLKENRRQDLVI